MKKLLLILAVVCWLGGMDSPLAPPVWAQINTDWDPPVGIPHPFALDGATKFGITNDVMQYTNPDFTYDYSDDGGTGAVVYRQMSNGVPYTHFVWPNCPYVTASNTGNPHGTEQLPRTTWPLNVGPGSVVMIRGTNTANNSGPGSKLTMSGAGTLEAPVFFMGYDKPWSTNLVSLTLPDFFEGSDTVSTGNLTTATSWIDRRELVIAGTNIILQNLAFKNAQTEIRNNLGGSPSYNIMIRDVYCEGTTNTSDQNVAFGFSGSSTSLWSTSISLWRAEVHHYGDVNGASENDRSGMVTGNYATNTWIMDTVIYGMGGDSSRIGADQGNPKHNLNYYVGRNLWFGNRENALDIKQANGGVVSQNVMHSFAESSSSGGTALAIHYSPNSVWIINNTISNCLQGIASTGVAAGDENAFFIGGNLVFDVLERGFYLNSAGGKFYVWNNTVYGSTNNFRTTGTLDGIDYRNNISAGVIDVGGAGYHLYIDNDTAPTSSATNWFFHNASGDIRVLWGGTTYTTSLDGFNGLSIAEGNVELDPEFVDPATMNFALQEGSPAIDEGTDITDILARFESQWGRTLEEVDLVGTPRSGAWDVGAFEYDSGAAPEITVTPGSLDFGNVSIGSTADLEVEVENTGTGTLVGTVSGAEAPFSIVSSASYSLSAGQTATITVRFSPVSATESTDNISFTGASGGSVSLTGTGTVPRKMRIRASGFRGGGGIAR